MRSSWVVLLVAIGCGGASDQAPEADGGKSHDAGRPSTDAGHVVTGQDSGDADDADSGQNQELVDSGVEGEDDGGPVGPRTVLLPEGGLDPDTAVIDEANGILQALKQTVYDHHTYINESAGTYDVDCSGFTNFVLQQAVPTDFAALVAGTVARPRAVDYVNFLTFLPGSAGSWHTVHDVSALVPGDFIAWLEPASLMSSDTGHVLIVAQAPVKISSGYSILIIDASMEGHGLVDARTVNHTTGVGEGTIVLTVDDANAPTGYRWSTETASVPYVVKVGLGHLQ